MNIPIEVVAAILTIVLGIVIAVITNNTKAVNWVFKEKIKYEKSTRLHK